MISQTTIGQLRDMHLGHLAEDIRERCEQATFAELGFDAQIELLVDKEWHRRRDRNAIDRIRAAGFCYPTANILDIDYATERCLSKNNISLFAECGYLVNGRNLIIMGATGVGKTYLACALGVAACRARYGCRYMRMPNLTDELAIAKEDGSFWTLIKQYRKYPLLILDEWLFNPVTPKNIDDIFQLIEYRYSERRSTIFCTQIETTEWMTAMGEGSAAESLIGRIIYRADKILIKGDSMRKRLESAD